MPIIISNISRTYSRTGIQQYEVKLNDVFLATFEHNSEDGMAECIRLAYESLIGVDIDQKVLDHRRYEFDKAMHMILSTINTKE